MGKNKKKKRFQKKPKMVHFGMGAIQGLKLPRIDISADCNWKELEKELKISEKSKTIKRPRHRIFPKQKTIEKVLEDTSMEINTIESKCETEKTELASDSSPEVTKYIAIDCEMVGVGPEGREHMLARCSLVNSRCETIYDKFVQPREPVIDYRYPLTGIKAKHLERGETFEVVQKEVSDIITNRVLVGHTLRCDLKVLLLDHPKFSQRDVSTYKSLKSKAKSNRPGLKLMCEVILGKTIQEGHHDSVEDATAAMQLYLLEKKNWERGLKRKRVGKEI